MGLYERLLEEKRRLEEADTEEDRERRRRTQRASAYLESQRRRSLPEGGYVGSEEIREQEERRMGELHRLEGFVVSGPRSLGDGYLFAHLRNKYRSQYHQLCGIYGKWAKPTLTSRYSAEHPNGDKLGATPGEDQPTLFDD